MDIQHSSRTHTNSSQSQKVRSSVLLIPLLVPKVFVVVVLRVVDIILGIKGCRVGSFRDKTRIIKLLENTEDINILQDEVCNIFK